MTLLAALGLSLVRGVGTITVFAVVTRVAIERRSGVGPQSYAKERCGRIQLALIGGPHLLYPQQGSGGGEVGEGDAHGDDGGSVGEVHVEATQCVKDKTMIVTRLPNISNAPASILRHWQYEEMERSP